MDEVSKEHMRHAGMKELPPCPNCHRKDWRYTRHYGAPPLQTLYVMATCKNCRGVQMLWRSNMKNIWERYMQAGGGVV
jgi:hypothetical protein